MAEQLPAVQSDVEVLPPGKAPERSQEESIAISILPYSRDDSRARYLGLRASGFTKREACKFIGIHESNVSLWRQDAEFADVESRLPEYKEELRREYLQLEFVRNFRYALKKDYEVLKKSVMQPTDLSQFEKNYLLKIRAQYTPQQYQILEAVAGVDTSGEGPVDFTRLVREIERERITVEK